MFNAFFDILYCLFPVQERVVFAKSFNGQYNDNPKYILEEMHRSHPEYTLVLAVSDMHRGDDIPDYIRRVDMKSRQYYYYKRTAKVVIDNVTGLYSALISNRSRKGRAVAAIRKICMRICQLKKQLLISTWHGTPLKHVGRDRIREEERSNYRYVYTCDCLIAGSEHEKNICRSAFGDVPIEVLGNARNDLLFCDEKTKADLRKKLKLPQDQKILLIAPTYRDHMAENGNGVFDGLNVDEILDCLHKKFGGNWIAVFRVHQNVLRALKNGKASHAAYYDGNQFDDMAEYLTVADALITDYSSTLFDVALTKTPCFLYTPDLKSYEEDRGLYLDMEELPFPYAVDGEGIKELICTYSPDRHIEKTSAFNQKTHNVNDGNASVRAVEFMMKKISEQ